MRYSLSGFTLIEILTSLTIIAILITISLPLARNFTLHAQDEILQKQFLSLIESAKSETLARNTHIAICKSNNQKTCGGEWQEGQLIFLDENEDGVIYHEKQIISVMQTSSKHGNVQWRAFPRYRNYLSFLPSGLMKSDNGTFLHCHKTISIWAIIINKAGRTRVVYPDNHGEIKDGHGNPLKCLPTLVYRS